MFGFGIGELVVVSLILLLLFGKRLPGTMKSLGESLRALRDGMRAEV
jgi:TatA/E family protein of Tat protein translocase